MLPDILEYIVRCNLDSVPLVHVLLVLQLDGVPSRYARAPARHGDDASDIGHMALCCQHDVLAATHDTLF